MTASPKRRREQGGLVVSVGGCGRCRIGVGSIILPLPGPDQRAARLGNGANQRSVRASGDSLRWPMRHYSDAALRPLFASVKDFRSRADIEGEARVVFKLNCKRICTTQHQICEQSNRAFGANGIGCA
jgi:hypothetical protein